MLEFNDENFSKEVIKSKTPVLIDFFASWCGPCQMLAPVLEELSKDSDLKNRLKFGKVSTEDYPDIAQNFNVQGIPCLVFINDGKEISRIVGFAPKPVLKAKIIAVLDAMSA